MRGWAVGVPTGLLLAFLLASCTLPFSSRDGVQIRVENRSGAPFDEVLVVFPRQSVEYGPLPPGSFSAYHTVDEAYRYAYVKISTGGEDLIIQPIDYVGEELLRPGRYTYALYVTPPPRQLTLELEGE